MTPRSSLGLSNDSPKVNPWRDDSLGFSGFANRLSRTLLEISSPEGFVVGLSGSWGSGKTTALNFTKEYLKKHNQEVEDPNDVVTIVDFEPWLFSGRADLIGSFFEVLAESLPSDLSKSKKLGLVAGKFTRRNSDSLAKLVAAVGVAVDPSMGVVTGAATSMGKKGLDGALDRWLETPSLQSAYEKLAKRLALEKRRIVVFIDDIDRLAPEEIRSMMQMVKSVGRLPYITYVLSYDRRHVLAALGGTAEDSSEEPSFAEKIVQQELALPQASKAALLNLLSQNIEPMISSIENSVRWNLIINHGVRRWIKTPRDVNRYTNSLRFIWPVLENEVDKADIIAIEGIRIFEPLIFNWIRSNVDFLFSEGAMLIGADEEKQERVNRLHKIIASSSDKLVIRLLSCLFPSRATQFYKEMPGFQEPFYQIVRRRGIGHVNIFQTYMAFRLSEQLVPHSIIQDIISNLHNQEALDAILGEWVMRTDSSETPMIGDLLSEIQYRLIEPASIDPTAELLNSLFSIGEKVSSLKYGSSRFELDARSILMMIIGQILENEKKYKFTLLQQALKHGRNAAYGLELFVLFGIQLGEIKEEGEQSACVVTPLEWEQYGDEVKTLFEEDLESGDFIRYPQTWITVLAYRKFFGDDECKNWLMQTAHSNTSFLLDVIDSLITTTVSENSTRFFIKNERKNGSYDLSGLLELAEAAKKAGGIEGDSLKRLDAFIEGVRGFTSDTPATD